jgi:hypothetical protein
MTHVMRKIKLQSAVLNLVSTSALPEHIKKAIYKFYNWNSTRILFKSNKKFLPKLTKDIDELKLGIEQEEFKRNRFPKIIYNKLFFSLSIRDIVRTHQLYLRTKDKEEQNLLSRFLALHLHEFIQDFQKLTGKTFRQQLQTIPYPEDILKRFDEIKGTYRLLTNKYTDLLAEIRHTAIAHKTKDVHVLVNNIKALDELQMREIATMCLLVHGLYDQFNTDVYHHLVKYPKEIAQIPYLLEENFSR